MNLHNNKKQTISTSLNNRKARKQATKSTFTRVSAPFKRSPNSFIHLYLFANPQQVEYILLVVNQRLLTIDDRKRD